MRKRAIRNTIDIAMTVLLLFLMARQITGETAHEWLGAAMFALWIIHHLLNRSWYSHLFKGKYTPVRMVQAAINAALLLSMLCMMVSGIVLSRDVFAFLSISGGLGWARPLHILSTFWGYVLMSLHLGLHWSMILGMIHKRAGTAAAKPVSISLRIISALIAGYGFYAFLHHQFLSYMFLTVHFVFFDYERASILFFADYIAVMWLFTFLAYYGIKALWMWDKRGK